MTWLSVLRSGYEVALLAAPDAFHGRPRTERLTTPPGAPCGWRPWST